MARIHRSISALFLALLVAPLGASCAERGAATPQEAADRYLSAARSGSVSAVANLAPADFDAEAEARAKVAAYALIRDASVDIVYRPNDITPNELGVEFVVNGGAFKDEVRIQYLQGRWYVMLGRARTSPTYPTAQPTR